MTPTRREILAAMSTMGAAALLPGAIAGCSGDADTLPVTPGAPAPVTKQRSDLIGDENAKPGGSRPPSE